MNSERLGRLRGTQVQLLLNSTDQMDPLLKVEVGARLFSRSGDDFVIAE